MTAGIMVHSTQAVVTLITMPNKKSPKRPAIDVEFRLRITVGDTHVIGPGKIALLEAVRTHGSITAAARSVGMSYPKAWRLLDELNQHLKFPALHSAKGGETGGHTTLTTVGEELIRHYRNIELTLPQTCANSIQGMVRLTKAPEATADELPAARPERERHTPRRVVHHPSALVR